MKVIAEILDYSDRMNAYNSPRVIVKDVWNDNQMVEITVGDKTVKVVGTEIIDAVNRCLNTNPVY